MDATTVAEASREDLVRMIAELEARLLEREKVISELQKRLEAVEKRLGSSGGSGMPGNKPAAKKPKPPAKERKKRERGFGRVRMEPTATVVHAIENCPTCGTTLVGGWVKRTREVIEIPPPTVQVTQHQYLERECPCCRTRHVAPPTLQGVVLGPKHRLGVGLVSLIVTFREEGRLPFATIQWYLDTVYHVTLSVGALVRVVQEVAQRGTGVVQEIQERIQQSAVVCADETGWRETGKNGYVWTFSTPTDRYFVRGPRSKTVVDEVLGPHFAGVLVSDFYAAYHHYLGPHQRCWAHLLRDIHDLKEIYPSDESLANWAAVVLRLYQEGKTFSSPDEPQRLTKQHDLEARLLAVCSPFLTDPLAVQAKLSRRMERHLTELFVFVGTPNVPATNNDAERSLRHVVTSRKISGGTQSPEGTKAKMTLASLFGTWRLRGLNPLAACHDLLTASYQ
jgi:transposase